jgi:hypothetical protein
LQKEYDIKAGSENDFDFGGEVERQSSRNEFRGKPNLLSCELCGNSHSTKWALKRHAKNCRQPDCNYIRVGKSGEYPCSVCHQVLSSRKLFNEHIFNTHSDPDVQAKYRKSVEDLLGAWTMNRLRTMVFTAIYSGKWDCLIGRLLNPEKPVDLNKIKRDCAFDAEEDDSNRLLREKVYDKQREILFKLATANESQMQLNPPFTKQTFFKDETAQYVFDMLRNLEEEWQSGYLLEPLKASLMSKRLNLSCLPRFISLEKCSGLITLTVSNYPVTLYSLLRDKDQLEEYGNKIVYSLTLALSSL